MIAFLLDCLIKSSVILLLAFAVAAMARNRSAATRHLIWSVALLAIVLLPALMLIVPPRLATNLTTLTRFSPPLAYSQASVPRYETLTNSDAPPTNLAILQ